MERYKGEERTCRDAKLDRGCRCGFTETKPLADNEHVTSARFVGWAIVALACVIGAAAQTPQPFPKPTTPPRPAAPPTAPAPAPAVPPPNVPSAPAAPTEAQLGFPLYPSAQFITSYDAGRGQRYFLFGTTAAFADAVSFYRTALKERGRLLFEQPATHWFEIGRFREDTMAFPPGVTVKDYTWGGSVGLPNTTAAGPRHFPTVIQIVPQAPGTK